MLITTIIVHIVDYLACIMIINIRITIIIVHVDLFPKSTSSQQNVHLDVHLESIERMIPKQSTPNWLLTNRLFECVADTNPNLVFA